MIMCRRDLEDTDGETETLQAVHVYQGCIHVCSAQIPGYKISAVM